MADNNKNIEKINSTIDLMDGNSDAINSQLIIMSGDITSIEENKSDKTTTYDVATIDEKNNNAITNITDEENRVKIISDKVEKGIIEPFISTSTTDIPSDAVPMNQKVITGDVHINTSTGKVQKYETDSWKNKMDITLDSGSTTEVINARVNTVTASSFDQLGDRVDDDYRVLNTKLDFNSSTSFNGRDIVIEGTYNSKVRNMEIRGKSICNLITSINSIMSWAGGVESVYDKFNHRLTYTIKAGTTPHMRHNFNVRQLELNKVYTVVVRIDSSTITNFGESGCSCTFMPVDKYLGYYSKFESLDGGLRSYVKSRDGNFLVRAFKITEVDNTKLNRSLDFALINNVAPLSDQTIIVSNMMILEGDWSNKKDAIPYIIDGLKSLGEDDFKDNKYPINVKSHSKNIFFDNKKYELSNFDPSNPSLQTHTICTSMDETTRDLIEIINASTSEKVTFGATLKGTDISKIDSTFRIVLDLQITWDDGVQQWYSVPTISQDLLFNGFNMIDTHTTDLRIGRRVKALSLKLNIRGMLGKFEVSNIFINIGESKTPSVYQTPSNKQILLDTPLKSINDKIYDEVKYILNNNTQLEELASIYRTGTMIFKGLDSERWVYDKSTNTDKYFTFKTTTSGIHPTLKTLLCDKFSCLFNDYLELDAFDGEGICMRPSNDGIYLKIAASTIGATISDTEAVKINKLKVYLTNNNIKCIYPLSTEIVTLLGNQDLNVNTFEGYTRIISNNSIKADKFTKVVLSDQTKKPIIPRDIQSLDEIQPNELAIYANPEVEFSLLKGSQVGTSKQYLFVKKPVEPTLHTVFKSLKTGTARVQINLTDNSGANISLESINLSKIKTVSMTVHNEDKTSITFNEVSSLPIITDIPMVAGQFLTIQLAQIPSVATWADDTVYNGQTPNLNMSLLMLDNPKELAINNRIVAYKDTVLQLAEASTLEKYDINAVYVDSVKSCRPSQVAVNQPNGSYTRHNDSEWGINVTDNITPTNSTKIAPYVGDSTTVEEISIGSTLKGYIYSMGFETNVTIQYRFVYGDITPDWTSKLLTPTDSITFELPLRAKQTPLGNTANEYLEVRSSTIPVGGKVVVDLSNDGTKYLSTFTNGKITRYIRQDDADLKINAITAKLNQLKSEILKL